MTARAAPIRFLVVVLGGWVTARVAWLSGGGTGSAVGVSAGTAVALAGIAIAPALDDGDRLAQLRPAPAVSVVIEEPWRGAHGSAVEIALDDPLPAGSAGSSVPIGQSPVQFAAFDRPPAGQPLAWVAPVSFQPPRQSRWSASGWLFARGGDGSRGLATGGQLGDSQAGMRLAYRLNFEGPTRFALAARLSSPLDDRRGAEAALGLDFHPLPGKPLRLSIERRVALGAWGRNAWSAYAAGGFYTGLPNGFVADGYAQAGVVGLRRGDLFADGAVRVGRPVPAGKSTVTVGGGVWGAAQPGASRLDIGPRVALTMPVDQAALTMAVDWRIKVAGNARPGSGLALTLASDF